MRASSRIRRTRPPRSGSRPSARFGRNAPTPRMPVGQVVARLRQRVNDWEVSDVDAADVSGPPPASSRLPGSAGARLRIRPFMALDDTAGTPLVALDHEELVIRR